MRVGFNFYNWDHKREWDLDRDLDLTRETGYEGFEFKAPEGLSPETVRRKCEEHGVECAALGGLVGARAGLQSALDFAGEAGIHILRSHVPKDETPRWVEYAAERGVTIVLHPHIGRGGKGTGLVETLDDMLAYLAERPGVMACPDTANLLHLGSDPVRAIHELGDLVRYVHLKDFDSARVEEHGVGGAMVDIGAGELDLAGVMKALEDIGYDGWLTVERDSRVEDYVQSARDMRQALRDLGY